MRLPARRASTPRPLAADGLRPVPRHAVGRTCPPACPRASWRGSAAWPTRGARRRTARSARAPHAGPAPALGADSEPAAPRTAAGGQGDGSIVPLDEGDKRTVPLPIREGGFAVADPRNCSACAWTFCKQGRLALLSHLEVARALERAVRRAGLPLRRQPRASRPHMRIAFGAALPVGVGGTARGASTCSSTRYVAPERALEALQAASAPDLMAKACALPRAWRAPAASGGVTR